MDGWIIDFIVTLRRQLVEVFLFGGTDEIS